MFWLIGLASIGCGSLILIVNSLRKAPEAFEDERGFHLIRRYAESAAVLRRKKLADKGGSGSLKEAEAHL
jgi:hypothetical protein